MPIEWPGGVSSAMNVTVEDNTGNPIRILEADAPFTVKITWTVPSGFSGLIAGSFRLRAYAESIGPGQEQQIGLTVTEPVVLNQGPYDADIAVGANILLGEGQGAPPVSGIYRIVAVLQHLNGAAPSDVSGFAEAGLRLFRIP
jgi:hypothetical protein